jgi:hypothetical protein
MYTEILTYKPRLKSQDIIYFTNQKPMKALFCFALLALASSAFAATQSQDVNNFIIGTWFTVYANVSSDCCTPTGTLTFTQGDSNSSYLTATQWQGSLCSQHGITPESTLKVPFGSESTYEDLPHLVGVTDASDFEKGLGDDNLYFFADGLFDSYIFPNGTREVLISLDVVPQNATGACSVLISKEGGI